MNPVLFWNQVAMETHRRDYADPMSAEQPGPTRTSRAFAVVHLAMYDALSVSSGLAAYLPGLAAPTGPAAASPEAAVGAAAAAALRWYWPRQQGWLADRVTEFRTNFLTNVPDPAPSENYGASVAQQLITQRESDGANKAGRYVPAGPFDHRPDPYASGQPFLDPHWGSVTPFLLKVNGTADYASYVPDWDRNAYDAALREVKAFGRFENSARSPEQTAIGLFWAYDGAKDIGTPPRLYNQCVIAARNAKDSKAAKNSMAQDARMLALIHAAMADAGVVAWWAKYVYKLWRPVIGVREHDKNFGPSLGSGRPPVGEGDPFWRPYGAPSSNLVGRTNATPPFPAYPSGHATFGAACFNIAAKFIGKDVAFTVVSDELNGQTTDPDGSKRTFHRRPLTFKQAINENADSRVYLGVHWRMDSDAGMNAGNKVAENVLRHPIAQ